MARKLATAQLFNYAFQEIRESCQGNDIKV